jgi:hypothetical protein
MSLDQERAETCSICHHVIGEQRYFPDPLESGFVHSLCLALETDLISHQRRIPFPSWRRRQFLAWRRTLLFETSGAGA